MGGEKVQRKLLIRKIFLTFSFIFSEEGWRGNYLKREKKRKG